jgi:ElaB/YqjD/DUF883 family membrane-anchored ribosome-binding protein
MEADPAIEMERAEVEEARAEMSRTIDEIEGRLTPSYMAGQARDNVIEAVGDAGSSLMDSVRQNPIPALVAGASIGYIVYRAFSVDRPARDNRRSSYAYEAGTDRTSGVRDAVDNVMRTSADAKDTLQEKVQETAQRTTEQSRMATSRVQATMRSNPLGSALVGLGVGAAIGLLLPRTQVEDNLMAPAAEPLRDRAEDVMEQVQQKAERVASTTAEAARDAVEKETS